MGAGISEEEESMICRDVMTTDPACCLPNESATRAAKLMKTGDVGSLPICDDRHTKKLLGIITDRDLAIKVVAEGRDPRTTRLEEIMSRNLVTCRADDDLQNAVKAMESHQVRRIPVVDQDNTLVGIIAQA